MAEQWLNVKEIHIPVSYGFIAAKVWGNDSGEPVLAMHGWQDNAGTFDRLIPLLSSNLHIVAIDGPGHGLSSHKPLGAFYEYMEMVEDLKRVVNFLKWEKFSIMGHSLGGGVAVLYASIFPETVKNVILFDIFKPASRDIRELPSMARSGIVNSLRFERKLLNPPPVYSFEEAKERLNAGLNNQVTAEAVNVLLKRGCRTSDCGKGVIFCRDLRVKMINSLYTFSHDDLKVYLSNIRCNLLIIAGKSSFIYKSQMPDVIGDFLNLYKELCKSFQIIEVEGNHYVHLNNPDKVASHVDKFFTMHCNKLSKI